MSALRRLFALAVTSGLIACADAAAPTTGGTLVIGVNAPPERLHPALVANIVERQIVDVLFDRLARLGSSLDPTDEAGFTRELATAWRWSADSQRVTFSLDPAARWHDGVPVRAHDVTFSFALLRDSTVGSPSRGELAMVDSVTADDSLTVSAWFASRSAFRFHDLVMSLVPVPAHVWEGRPREALRADPLLREPVGSGRFRMGRAFDGEQLVLVADSTHPRGRPRVDRLIWRVAPDPATNLARLRTGEIDVIEQVSTDVVRALAGDTMVRFAIGDAFDYGYLQFNLFVGGSATPHPILTDLTVRRALTIGTDRATLVRAVFDTFAVVAAGPFVRRQFGAAPALDTMRVDTTAAAALLDAAGWRRGADGMRRRDGRPLAVSVLVPTSSAPRLKMAEVLQEQWRTLGVALRVEAVEPATIGERMRGRDFETVFGSIRTSVTPSGLRQSWGSAGAAPGGRNVGRYTSARFDAQLDSAFSTRSAEAARSHLRDAYATLLADAPAVYLYEWSSIVALTRRVEAPPIRGDAWWFDLARWGVSGSVTRAR